jgi:cytochrome oxidase Cu insertion factor (SCO1/SenC/PrrC family)
MHRLKGKTRLAVAIACMGLLAGCSAPSPPAASSPPSLVGTQLNHAVPKPLLGLPFTNSQGERVTLGSFRGKTVVISDMMTLCQETCAIGTASMLEAARAVDRAGLTSQIEFLSITIDPGRDDVRHLAAYERSFGHLANWELLTGDPAAVNELWDRLGVWRRTVSLSPPYPRDWLTHQPLAVDIQHSDDLIFLSPDQRFRFEIDGPASVPSVHSLPSRIYAFMDGVGHQNVRSPSAGSWSARQVLQVLRWILQVGEPE